MRAEDGKFMCEIWSLCGVLMMGGKIPPGVHNKKSEHPALVPRNRTKMNYRADEALAELNAICFL